MHTIKKLSFEQLKEYIDEEKHLDKKHNRPEDDHNLLTYDENDRLNEYYGLYYENQMVGFAAMDRANHHLYRYHIGKDHRRKGHGLRFLFKLRVDTLDVRRDNEEAIRVYERYGMVEKLEDSSSVVIHMVKC